MTQLDSINSESDRVEARDSIRLPTDLQGDTSVTTLGDCSSRCPSTGSSVQSHQYFLLSSMLLIYDTLLSVGQDYRYIWKSEWGVVKVLYLWTRYGAFIDTAMAVHKRLNAGPSFFFSGIGMGITEIILMIRTYAQYNRSRKLLAFFLLLWFWTKSFTVEASVPSLTSCNVETDTTGIGLNVTMLGMETSCKTSA
ncbi:hypothetical protein GGX14DRAFT_603413 [Mycena pura]|uniref:DUF6533 domain-containing protein n=1 Tax=Mycena pura TaxID=153505 RepID=A0AAD6UPD5_9AGAR|nr:hypothetical protein GGX14DRAFT_603413 [Mycena pura]